MSKFEKGEGLKTGKKMGSHNKKIFNNQPLRNRAMRRPTNRGK